MSLEDRSGGSAPAWRPIPAGTRRVEGEASLHEECVAASCFGPYRKIDGFSK
jgi:hypothetical protein